MKQHQQIHFKTGQNCTINSIKIETKHLQILDLNGYLENAHNQMIFHHVHLYEHANVNLLTWDLDLFQLPKQKK